MNALTRVTAGTRNIAVVGRCAVQPSFHQGVALKDRGLRSNCVDFLPIQSTSDQTSTRDLTDRECTILQLLSHGLSNKEAAKSLEISPETVKSHVKSIFHKLKVERRAQAVSRGLGLGVISLISI